MKRSVAVRLLGTTCLVLSCLALASSGNAEALLSPSPLADLAYSLRTPEAVAHYMWRHFAYESDQVHFAQEDRWQSPEELMTSGRGDCEDFALFAHEILSRNRIPSFLLSLYGRGYGHTVCVFKEGGRYNVIDGVRLRRYGAGTLEGLFEEIYPFWKKAAIVGLSSSGQPAVLKQFKKE